MDLWPQEGHFQPILESSVPHTVSESNKTSECNSQWRQTIALYNARAPAGIPSTHKSCDSVQSIKRFPEFGNAALSDERRQVRRECVCGGGAGQAVSKLCAHESLLGQGG